jgi:2-amino-4-hydroxy-6-hydroxymethyldihydropteridine diphosphokinase
MTQNYELSIIDYQLSIIYQLSITISSIIFSLFQSMEKYNKTAYLGLGSNLGDRAANLMRAISSLVAADLRLMVLSSIYETEPVDYPEQPSFLNMVVAVRDVQEPFSFLRFCLETEKKLGRRRIIPRGARTIDIDLLMVDDLIIDDKRDDICLTLPHPRMHMRRFVLEPMNEIAPELEHPVLHVKISQLLDALDDSAAVRVYLD